jgi:hypothetical protein
MSKTVDEMRLCDAVLALVEAHRGQSGDPALGAFFERAIMDRQFQALETDILEDPGAIEPWLIRRRDA